MDRKLRGLLARIGTEKNGYGSEDRALADALRKCKNAEQADAVARADGHVDAAGAVNWLTERS